MKWEKTTLKSISKKAIAYATERTGAKCACAVVILCSAPSKEGNMEVEMSFEGDPLLASFLLERGAESLQT